MSQDGGSETPLLAGFLKKLKILFCTLKIRQDYILDPKVHLPPPPAERGACLPAGRSEERDFRARTINGSAFRM